MVAEFNPEITKRMLDVAVEKAQALKLDIKYTCKVPGIFDMPVIIDELLSKKEIDGIVTLGAVLKGQTKHDEVIAHATVTRIQKLSVEHKKPVSLGISGPGMQERHAYARIRPVAERAIDAVLKVSKELEKIR